MIAIQNFYDMYFTFFYPTASDTVYGRRPKFFRAEHLATAEGENWVYGPTLVLSLIRNWFMLQLNMNDFSVLVGPLW